MLKVLTSSFHRCLKTDFVNAMLVPLVLWICDIAILALQVLFAKRIGQSRMIQPVAETAVSVAKPAILHESVMPILASSGRAYFALPCKITSFSTTIAWMKTIPSSMRQALPAFPIAKTIAKLQSACLEILARFCRTPSSSLIYHAPLPGFFTFMLSLKARQEYLMALTHPK